MFDLLLVVLKNRNKLIKYIPRVLNPCYIQEPIEYSISEKNKLAYIVNSKVACSSFKKVILTCDDIAVNSNNYGDIHIKSISNRRSIEDINIDEYFVFSFVRDPLKRIVSLYINKFLDEDKISKNGFEYEGYLGGIIKRDISFKDFVMIISKIPDRLSERHFKSQYYLIKKQSAKCDFIGKMESMNVDYLKIQERFNLPLLGNDNKSNSYNYMDYYDSESLQLIYERYKEDILEFGYIEEYEKVKEYCQSK